MITEQPMRLSLLLPHLNFFVKDSPIPRHSGADKLPFVGYRNRACFFRYNDRMGIRHLRYSHRRTMPQTQFFRNIQIVRHGQDTSCRLNALLADNHSSVVQRAVLEKIFSIRRWFISALIISPVRTTSSNGILCSTTINAPTFCLPILIQAITTGIISSCSMPSFLFPVKKRTNALAC